MYQIVEQALPKCGILFKRVEDGYIKVVAEAKYLEHRCHHCGGRIRITGRGYYCENCFGKNPSCMFHCNGILSHRFIQPHEIEAYLDGHPVILDGCHNSQGRIFSAVLMENDGSFTLIVYFIKLFFAN